jgi:hypothetical protein
MAANLLKPESKEMLRIGGVYWPTLSFSGLVA